MARTLLAALLLAAPGAEAQPTDEVRIRKAQAYVDLGTELFRRGDYESALAEFRRAEPLADGAARASVRFNIARCLEERGQLAAAIAAFEAYLELPDEAASQAAARRRIDALRQRALGELRLECVPAAAEISVDGGPVGPCSEPVTGLAPGAHVVEIGSPDGVTATRTVELAAGQRAALRVVLDSALVVQTPVDDSEVTVDGAPVEAGALLPLRPGPHTIRVRAPGHTDYELALTLAPGERRTTVSRHLPAGAGAASAPPRREPRADRPASVSEAPAAPDQGPSRWPAWAAAGAAVAVTGVGGYFWYRVAAGFDDADAAYDRYQRATAPDDVRRERAAAESAFDDARRDRLLTFGFVGAGVALGGLATWLFLRDDGGPVATAGPGGAGLGLAGRW